MRRAACTAIVAMLLVVGCAPAVPAQCSDEGMDPQPELTCDLAVPVIRERLSSVPGVAGFEVRYGGFCPVGAGCGEVSDANSVRVFVEMLSGTEQHMLVTMAPDGSFRISGPGPLPGPTPLE